MIDYNRVEIPMYELDDDGAILPNPIFHRAWDKLHSRTIEYPFAASQLGSAERILDVGSVKGDLAWTSWLESLPIDVHVTDYDADDDGVFKKSTFHQADIRHLEIEDNYFDKILAISVIEHIGMDAPQVIDENLPPTDNFGDAVAFKEMLRVLKPGGHIVMTFPYGIVDSPIDDSARTYTKETIQRFNDLAEPIVLDYYEYQYNDFENIYIEYPKTKIPTIGERIGQKISGRSRPINTAKPKPAIPRQFGVVTWRRIPIKDTQATNVEGHIDGVLCGVWQKPLSVENES